MSAPREARAATLAEARAALWEHFDECPSCNSGMPEFCPDTERLFEAAVTAARREEREPLEAKLREYCEYAASNRSFWLEEAAQIAERLNIEKGRCSQAETARGIAKMLRAAARIRARGETR